MNIGCKSRGRKRGPNAGSLTVELDQESEVIPQIKGQSLHSDMMRRAMTTQGAFAENDVNCGVRV